MLVWFDCKRLALLCSCDYRGACMQCMHAYHRAAVLPALHAGAVACVWACGHTRASDLRPHKSPLHVDRCTAKAALCVSKSRADVHDCSVDVSLCTPQPPPRSTPRPPHPRTAVLHPTVDVAVIINQRLCHVCRITRIGRASCQRPISRSPRSTSSHVPPHQAAESRCTTRLRATAAPPVPAHSRPHPPPLRDTPSYPEPPR